ncbi:rRNA pseudouridine synthase [Candidatus Saccharibacteria bacterium]|nr:rRNA pseudouridine synthase [Candidatus Saccharibacteria bacterium]
MTNNEIRLNKYIATNFGVSRREADELIAAGRVKINDKKAEIGMRAHEGDTITVDGRNILEQEPVYLALHKPVGYVCSRKKQGDTPTLYDLLPKKYQVLKTVGRLDKDSSGLILLTNDGDFAFQMTHPKFSKTKLYTVEIDRDLEPLHQQMIADFGIQLPDGRSQMGLSKIGESRKKWDVSISEGRNRQIRRTFEALGYKVVSLHRYKFGPYELSGLPEGEFTEVKKAL